MTNYADAWQVRVRELTRGRWSAGVIRPGQNKQVVERIRYYKMRSPWKAARRGLSDLRRQCSGLPSAVAVEFVLLATSGHEGSGAVNADDAGWLVHVREAKPGGWYAAISPPGQPPNPGRPADPWWGLITTRFPWRAARQGFRDLRRQFGGRLPQRVTIEFVPRGVPTGSLPSNPIPPGWLPPRSGGYPDQYAKRPRMAVPPGSVHPPRGPAGISRPTPTHVRVIIDTSATCQQDED